MNKKLHKFDPVIYPFKLWIMIGIDKKIISDTFLYIDGKQINVEIVDINEATTFHVELKEDKWARGVLIVFSKREYTNAKNIAHEGTHAARYMWRQIGEDITGEEADAYLVGWIANCCNIVKNYKNGKVTDSVS